MLLKTRDIKKLLMFCLTIKQWDIKGKEFKVNYIELMMFLNFFCLVLMIKDTY